MERITELVKEMLEAETTSSRIEELRNEIINIIFSYGDGSIFKDLCRWNLAVEQRILATRNNIEVPGNKTDVAAIIDIARTLDFKI